MAQAPLAASLGCLLRRLGGASAALLLVAVAPGPAGADGPPARTPEIGFLGLSAPDLDAEPLRAIEGRIEDGLARLRPVRRRDELRAALLRDPAIARDLAEARTAAATGSEALRAFELATAREKLDLASARFEAAHADWLAAEEYARVLEAKSRLFYAQRMPAEMRREIARLLPLRPRKSIEPGSMPPDALALFEEELAAARARPFGAPDGARAAALADRGGVRWIAVGEARRRDAGVEILLALGSSTGTLVSRTLRLSPATPATELDRELSALLDVAGIAPAARLERALVTRPAPAPPPPPRATTSRRGWYVAGAALAGALAAGALVLSTSARDSNGNGAPPPPDESVSIVVEDP